MLNFSYETGAALPQTQSVQVTGTAGAAFTATASGVNGTPNFLTMAPSAASAPATLTVGLNAATVATLPTGQYSGTVTISSPTIPGGSSMRRRTELAVGAFAGRRPVISS